MVDNHSRDGSADMVRERFTWARLVQAERNLGFGPAINLVAERTATPWLLATNADVELSQGALDALLQRGEDDRRAGIVAPRLILPDGTTQHSVYSFPTLLFTLGFNLGLAGLSGRIADRLALEGRWDPDRPRTVDWAIGACLLVRRTAWDAVGGFDPDQWMYAEDLDLGWRMAAANWHTRFEPAAIVRHHGAAAASQRWGDETAREWLPSTYAWMLQRRGPLVMRTSALVNALGAAARAAIYTLPAFFAAREYRGRMGTNLAWMRLHLANLMSSQAELGRHRAGLGSPEDR